MTDKRDLTIIILSYNSQFWLKKTLQTLKEYYLLKTAFQIKVVVIDNNSSDDSLAMIRQQFRWVELLPMAENKGYAAGNNVALKSVTSRYAMLLNSDVEFTSSSNLDELITYLDSHQEVGVITPRVEFSDGRLDLACHRGEPTLWASLSYFSGLESALPFWPITASYHQLYKDFETIHEIDACSGAAMLVRTAAMKKVGLLDEQFFMYAEDLDWCRRFREAGYQVHYYPLVKVIHHKYKSGLSSSSRQTATKTQAHFYDTMLQYYDKHYATKYPGWVRTVIKHVVNLKKGAS